MAIVGVQGRMIPASWSFAAILIITVCGPLGAQAGGAKLTLREILRIDGEREDLSALGPMAASDRGVLAIRLPQDGVIRLFRSDGSALATVGRAGAGPGEFRAVVTNADGIESLVLYAVGR